MKNSYEKTEAWIFPTMSQSKTTYMLHASDGKYRSATELFVQHCAQSLDYGCYQFEHASVVRACAPQLVPLPNCFSSSASVICSIGPCVGSAGSMFSCWFSTSKRSSIYSVHLPVICARPWPFNNVPFSLRNCLRKIFEYLITIWQNFLEKFLKMTKESLPNFMDVKAVLLRKHGLWYLSRHRHQKKNLSEIFDHYRNFHF